MKLQFTQYNTLPCGTYILEYVNDGLNDNGTMMFIDFKVVESDFNNKGVKTRLNIIHECSSQQILAIGQKMRKSIFQAIVSKENIDLFNEIKDSNYLFGKKFKCVVGQRNDEYDLINPIKNKFTGFQCILTDNEKKKIGQELQEIINNLKV